MEQPRAAPMQRRRDGTGCLESPRKSGNKRRGVTQIKHLGLDLGSSITAACGPAELSALRFNERSDSYQDVVPELQAIKTTMQVDERPEEIGVISNKLPAEDLGLREERLEGLAEVVKESLESLAPGSGEGVQVSPVPVSGAASSGTSTRGAPRVDAPEVEDKIGQAIPENEPGYIACAFPKLFPFGTGDYHDARRGLQGKPSLADWGRYVLLWQDGRFMRHTRFRYWLLDTWLRGMSPSQRNLFMEIYPQLQRLR